MDVRLEFLDAAHGDSILLSWGRPERLVVIDGGPTGSFETSLGPRLEAIRQARVGEEGVLSVDLVSVSHIDDDHIAGVIRFLTDIRRRQRDGLPPRFGVDRLWHNSFEELISTTSGASVADVERDVGELMRAEVAVAASVNQGRDVRDLGRALGVDGNEPFAGPVLGGLTTTLHGLDLTIIAPDQGALDKLEKTWREAKVSKRPEVLAAAFTDRSVPNLSSICMLVGGSAGRALLTADARGDHVMAGLEEAGLLQPGGTMHVDVLQVPHHGSANNSDERLFERVTADHYVISADGIKHHHPDPSVLDSIVLARGSDSYTIHLTNPIPAAVAHLEQLSDGKNFAVDVRSDPAPGIVIDIAA